VPTVSFSIISTSIGDVMFIYLTPFVPLSFKGEGERLPLKGLRPFNLPLRRRIIVSEGANTPSEFPRL